MTHNYYPWDGLINRLRACDEHVARLQENDMANADLDAHITGNYGEDQHKGPCRQRGFDRWDWNQPDEAWGSDKTDKEIDDETV